MMNEGKEKLKNKTVITEEVDKMLNQEEGLSELEKIVGIYTVKPVMETWLSNMSHLKEKRSMYPDNIFYSYTPELDPNTKGVVITGLTAAQRQEFEQEMNLKPGTMSSYNLDFWSTYYIKIPEKGKTLNCNTVVKDKLDYILLRNNSKVAQSMSDLPFKINAELVLTSEEVEKQVQSKEVGLKEKAYSKLSGMSLTERMDFLKVFDEGKYKVGKSAKPDFVHSAIGEIVDKQPSNFLSTFDNPFYQEAIFLQDCIAIRAVTTKGQKYYMMTGEKIGDSYLQTLQNLQSPDWNEAKVSLLGKLQASK